MNSPDTVTGRTLQSNCGWRGGVNTKRSEQHGRAHRVHAYVSANDGMRRQSNQVEILTSRFAKPARYAYNRRERPAERMGRSAGQAD